MTVGPFTTALFLTSLILFALTCTALWWGWDERRHNLRLKQQLRDARRRLHTYRQWADDHVYLAFQPAPEDQEQ